MTPQFRIAWSVPATGVNGYGEYCLSYEIGQSFLHSLKKHTDMEHWMEEKGGKKIYYTKKVEGGGEGRRATKYFKLKF